MNWYANEELGKLRNQEDIRTAEHSRLISEALLVDAKVSVKDKVFGAIGALMVRSGSWLQKQSRIQKQAINSMMDVTSQNGRACATC